MINCAMGICRYDMCAENKSERGQMLLIVILSMIVALTVGLSVISRTVVNLKVSKQNEESQRAFQAAEAGIEQAIKQVQTNGPVTTVLNPSAPFSNNATYTTNIAVSNNLRSFLMNSGTPLTQDSGMDLWLSHYPNYSATLSRSINLYWGTSGQTSCSGSGTNVRPALEVLVLSSSLGNPTMDKYIFEANCTRIPGAVQPTLASTSINGTTLQFGVTISFTNGYIMKIIPIFNSGVVGVTAPSPGPPLPSQGVSIQSTGSSGETVRKIQYFMAYPGIPIELFPYSLVSQN